MYRIVFYKNARGEQPVKEYIISLKQNTDKNSRVNYKKTLDLIMALSEFGLNLGMPYIRRIDSDIWELRPIRNRILFFCYENEEFVLLHHFIKKSNKTPKREIEKARKEMKNYIGGKNE